VYVSVTYYGFLTGTWLQYLVVIYFQDITERLVVTIRSSVQVNTLQVIYMNTNVHSLQKLVKMPIYERLGCLRLFMFQDFNEVTSHNLTKVSFIVTKIWHDRMQNV
jgi:hypothetical protein